jgi:hypothetical protein
MTGEYPTLENLQNISCEFSAALVSSIRYWKMNGRYSLNGMILWPFEKCSLENEGGGD